MDNYSVPTYKRFFTPSYWKRFLSPTYLYFAIKKKITVELYWLCWRLFVGRKRYGIGILQSYSQSGEDLVVLHIWKNILKRTYSLTYLDIGAHHPTYLSNTCLFYKNGSRGINIEPDPVLFERFIKERTEDINLNIGIGIEKNDEADFYLMQNSGNNTFSREAVSEFIRKGSKLLQVIKIPLRTIDSIIDNFREKIRDNNDCRSIVPDFVSIDAEGLDAAILKTWSFDKYRPAIFCIETDKKNSYDEIKNIMKTANYSIFENIGANTIFVDSYFVQK
jgi:FkbM family methyltransferase